MKYAVTGALTIGEVSSHAEALTSLLATNATGDTHLTLNLEALSAFDLAGLQLLFSAKRECKERGLGLFLEGSDNARRIANMIDFCGLPSLSSGAEE